MTKTNILIFLFLASFTVIVAQTKKPPMGNANAPSLKNANFIDTPRYIPAVRIPVLSINTALDSIERYFLPQFGKAKSVDESDQWKEFLTRQLRVTMLRGYQLDSIVTTKK